jgi:hypothetical protein
LLWHVGVEAWMGWKVLARFDFRERSDEKL